MSISSINRDTTTTNAHAIAEMITSSVVDNFPIQIQLANQGMTYISHFHLQHDGMAALIEGEYIDIAALDPPVGNVRILKCEEVLIQFYTTRHVIETVVPFIERVDQHTLRLGFPDTVYYSHQRRSAYRVEFESSWPVSLKIIRPSGLSFLGKLEDISIGGTLFHAMGPTPRIANKARVTLVIEWRDMDILVKTDAMMLHQFNKAGELCFRARFMPKSHTIARTIEELVAAAQRKQIQRRRRLLGD
ncbi:MAG: hypothetical protein HQL54_04005 [Magnetococcales bacterium]|nr:hypothetical protein [Magnetococcales bacterium]